jgi:hypothetical protein
MEMKNHSTTKEGKMLKRATLFFWLVGILMMAGGLIWPSDAVAGKSETINNQRKWWNVVPEPENPSKQYDSILYSEIAPKLREIEKNSNRVKVDVIGQSAGGRNLFLVTLSAPEAMGRLGQYQAIRKTMLKDPDKAQEMIKKFGDFKVPVFINGSIHGNEYPGVDAVIRLIEKLAYENSDEVNHLLENIILLVNVVQNPDGRVMGTRANANGFDINRDFITQSQPETRATVKVFTEWNPMVVLDLHGFVDPMLIEPCTPPHNPNYEYDLYIKWALAEAEAMEAELFAQTGFSAQIPYRDIDLGWDDWPPSYTPMYGMYHGAYGHMLETPYRDERGVDAHYWAVWGALKFIAQNREGMIFDQIEIFRRGFLDLLQQPVPPELLPAYPQYEDLMIQDFPAAYVIPKDTPFQASPHQAVRIVDFLLFNGVRVEQTSLPFNMDGVDYPKGTYVVWLDQPKRGLANTILSDGLDLSAIPGLFFYSPPSVWSNARLWGAQLAVMENKMDIKTQAINKPDVPRGSVEHGYAAAYAYLPTSIAAFQATNDLLAFGVPLYRASETFADAGRDVGAGAIIIPEDSSLANALADQWGLDLLALKEMPNGLVPMQKQKIAVYGSAEVYHCLKTLGFEFDALSTSQLNAGAISGYDLFINDDLGWSGLNSEGQAFFHEWFTQGGDYVGLSYRGRAARFAIDAGIADVDIQSLGPFNAIVKIEYTSGDSVSAGFSQEGDAFVYYPLWFTRVGENVQVSARYDDDDFLISGFWTDWATSGAKGMPVIVHGSNGDEEKQDFTLVGIDVTFRGHPENTFRIIGNAIYDGLD